MGTLKFQVESAGGVASRVQVGGHDLVFDQPEAAGGQDLGPSPLGVFAASAGACAHFYAALFLTRRGFPVEGLSVSVSADKAEDGSSRLSHLHLRVTLPPSTPTKYLAAIEKAVRGCPVYGTLVQTPVMELEMVLGEETAG